MDIRELAKHLDLSIGTVSRALNGRRDVSDATRNRVAAAALELGYTPNHAGRSLRSGRMGAVGFVLTLDHDEAVHGAPFFMSLFEGIQQRLSRDDTDLVVLLSRKGENGLGFLARHVSRRMVDGWILSATERQDARIPFLLERGIPFVALGRSGVDGDYASIDLDFEGVVHTAMARLLADGHQRIGLVAPPVSINNSHIVVEAYRAAVEQAGLFFDADLVSHGDADEDHGEAAAERFAALADRPTGLLVMGETAPVGVYRGLRNAGLAPGADVAVIGLRDAPAANMLQPGLACFSVELEQLGVALGEAIARQMDVGDQTPINVNQRWPMHLLLRGSERWSGAGTVR